MTYSQVNINFDLLAKAFQKYIREKALQSGSTIVYKLNDQLIEEDPQTLKRKILKDYTHITK